MGGSLAIDGAAALADAFQKCQGDYELAFQEYDKSFRPFIEEVQANAASSLVVLSAGPAFLTVSIFTQLGQI